MTYDTLGRPGNTSRNSPLSRCLHANRPGSRNSRFEAPRSALQLFMPLALHQQLLLHLLEVYSLGGSLLFFSASHAGIQ